MGEPYSPPAQTVDGTEYAPRHIPTDEDRSHDGNVPDLPWLVTAPPGLVAQWVQQCRRFFANGSFAVIAYTSAAKKQREAFFQVWDTPNSPIKRVPPIRRVIIASTSVCVALDSLLDAYVSWF